MKLSSCRSRISHCGGVPTHWVGLLIPDVNAFWRKWMGKWKNWFPFGGVGVIGRSRGAAGTPPPTGSNSFIFTHVFAEKRMYQRSPPPQQVGAPPTGNPGSATWCALAVDSPLLRDNNDVGCVSPTPLVTGNKHVI